MQSQPYSLQSWGSAQGGRCRADCACPGCSSSWLFPWLRTPAHHTSSSPKTCSSAKAHVHLCRGTSCPLPRHQGWGWWETGQPPVCLTVPVAIVGLQFTTAGSPLSLPSATSILLPDCQPSWAKSSALQAHFRCRTTSSCMRVSACHKALMFHRTLWFCFAVKSWPIQKPYEVGRLYRN